MSQANAEVELIRAINAVRGRDWAAAADLTTSLRREFPSHELGYEVGANAARMLRRFDEAARIRDEAARRFGASFWLALEQTLAAQAVEDWAGVYEAAARLRAQFPDQRAGYQLGITAARELRRLADATAVARAALEKFQGEAWVVLAQLTIALAQGDSAETLRLAAALRASDPAEPRGYSLAVGTLRGLERFDEALALLREAEPRFAAEPWFKTRSAEIAALRGDPYGLLRSWPRSPPCRRRRPRPIGRRSQSSLACTAPAPRLPPRSSRASDMGSAVPCSSPARTTLTAIRSTKRSMRGTRNCSRNSE